MQKPSKHTDWKKENNNSAVSAFVLDVKYFHMIQFCVQLSKVIEIERDDVRLSCCYSVIQKNSYDSRHWIKIKDINIFDHLSWGISRRLKK